MSDLKDLQVYQLAYSFEEKVWELVENWQYFEKSTIGKQLVRSADSISANISEGYGRYHYKENKNFLFYARGSLYETQNWLRKANDRNLIDEAIYKDLKEESIRIAKMLNAYIRSIGRKGS
nr:four helix bundle protein [uncultured Marinifilum sp.]